MRSERELWLDENGITEEAILEDEEGEFFFWTDEDGSMEQIRVPEHLWLVNN